MSHSASGVLMLDAFSINAFHDPLSCRRPNLRRAFFHPHNRTADAARTVQCQDASALKYENPKLIKRRLFFRHALFFASTPRCSLCPVGCGSGWPHAWCSNRVGEHRLSCCHNLFSSSSVSPVS
jgi:hypothetical protein